MMNYHATDVDNVTRWTCVTIAGLLIAIMPLAFWGGIPFQYLLLAITLAVTIPFLLSVEKIVCLLTFYIIAFGVPLFKGDLYPVSVNYLVIDLGMVLLFLFLLGEISLESNATSENRHFAWPLMIFLLVLGLSFLVGLNYSNVFHKIRSEIRIIGYYAVYFIAVRHFKDDNRIKMFSITVIIATLLASLDYIYTYLSGSHDRFVSRQVHIFSLVIPFFVSALILDKSLVRRIIYFLMLIPVGLSVITSQTRGTWVATTIAILLAALLSAFASKTGHRKVFASIVTLLAVGVVVWLGFSFIGATSRIKAESVETRAASLTQLQGDRSLLMRANSYWTIYQKIRERPLLGNGLGDTATYLFFGYRSTQGNVDSTYLTILWKMGILGLIAFGVLYFLLLRRAFCIYREEQAPFLKVFSIGMLSAFSALLILGIISPILISSRFNFLFGVLFAITETVAKRTGKSN